LRLVFDAGAAAYRATNYDAALQDFQAATLSPDLKLQQQAFYNLGNTLYRMGELKFTPDADRFGRDGPKRGRTRCKATRTRRN
jgi:TolA-binding protein